MSPVPRLLCLAVLLASAAGNEPPTFQDNMDYHVISENTPIGKDVYTLRGSDPEGSAVIYGLSGTDILQVNPRSGVVSVQKRIDHEKMQTLKLEVTLEDRVEGGDNNLITVPITVIIVDANDNPPKFEKVLHKAELREDAAVGSEVIPRIEVTDPDLVGENLNVSCDAARSSRDACSLFAVVPAESTSQLFLGALVLQSPLMLIAETNQQISLSLRATDGQFSASSSVVVLVKDVQNRGPVFSGSRTAVVDEDAPVGSPVMTLTAADGDSGDARRIVFELVENPGEYFSLDEETGVITTAKKLDRESILAKSGAVHISVKAVEVDGGRRLYGPLTETATDLTITVRDANDEPPRFSQQEYSTSISENLRDGTPLPGLGITVSDADLGVSSAFSVRLVDSSGAFSVEPTSGTGSSALSVRLASGPLDFENPNHRKFILLLVAEESRTPERLASTATVTVSVTDVNDNPPHFSLDAHIAQVSEMSRPGTIITTVSAEDRDSGLFGEEGIVYKLNGAGAERFSIDPKTGTVVVGLCDTIGVTPCIDYETTRDYFLNVEATDNAGSGLTATVPLKIVTLDANDNAPAFSTDAYRAVIREGATRFDPPLVVSARDLDATSQLTYSLPEGGVFSIDPTSGEVTVNNTDGIDLADVDGQEALELTAEVTDGIHSVSIPLYVEIRDTNNNAPKFASDAYQAVLPESVPIGTVVEQVAASDSDVGDNARLQYRLQRGGYDDFSVDPTEGVVTLARRLRHDRHSSYSIEILAVDAGSPPQTGTTTLSVTVIDSNDKSPYFTPATQQAEVSEDVAVDAPFYRLRATDPDVASPEDLVFSLVGAVAAVREDGQPVDRLSDEYKSFFNVTPDGSVVAAEPLQRDLASVVTLSVSVADVSAVPPQTSTGRLLITIVDVNEYGPEFAAPWTPERPVLTYELREEMRPGTVFGRVRATDRDTQVRRYQASESEHIGLNATTGELSVTSRVDYESVTSLSLSVTAFDSGVPQRNATAELIINVVNVNDEAPRFEQDVYSASVEEHATPGIEIVTVSATDDDAGKYGEVSYAIPGRLAENFSVDALGVVRLTTDLDRETAPHVLLTVAAFDMGPDQGRRSASTLVNITVMDINDQQPVFTRPVYRASIVEDIPLSPPSPILQVVATDGDAGENARVRYSLQPSPAAALFRLDDTSGFLYATARVSADTPELSLSAMATDGTFNDSAEVLLTVIAANHDKPRFTTPARDNQVYYVEENTLEAGSLVLTAQAEDRDSGENGRVSYYFRVSEQDGTETDEFSIDPETGQIRTRLRFDRETREKYSLVLVARDHGAPIPHEAVRYVQVHVRDVDDHVAHFTEHVNRFSLLENAPAGSVLGAVEAFDQDAAETSRVFYFAVGGDTDSFSVHPRTGVVSAARALDRERRRDYQLTVKATSNASFYAANVSADESDPTLTLVLITVLDVNDSPPKFQAKQYYAGVSEDAQFRDPVTTVSASDPDQGENAQLLYTIRSTELYKPGSTQSSGGIVPSPFAIDSAGRLTCATLMGEYKHHRFIVHVTAREKLPPARQAQATVHVWVYDTTQLVHVTLGVPPDAVVNHPETLVKAFSNATNGRVVIDTVSYHVTEENTVRRGWSDVYLHVADARQQIVATDEVLGAFDVNSAFLQEAYPELSLQRVQAATVAPPVRDASPTLATLVALLLVLLVGLLAFCAVCCCLRNAPAHVPAPPSVQKPPPPPTIPPAEQHPETDNPLWVGHKVNMFEEQELSMQVLTDPEPNAATTPSADEVASNTYATISRPDGGDAGDSPPITGGSGAGDLPDYATLGRYSNATYPRGPTIPGVVPARDAALRSPSPPPQQREEAVANNHRRLSVGADGRPELVSELN